MNKLFEELSLMAGGSHYPSINPDLQQKFGESIVKHIIAKLDAEIEIAYAQEQDWTAATLSALSLEILENFDMEIGEDE